VPALKARLNPDLHMDGDLRVTRTDKLFVIFGKPDIKIEAPATGMIRVKVFGSMWSSRQTGEVVSEGTVYIVLDARHLCGKRLFSRWKRSLQGAEDHAKTDIDE
jgi:hypothetical protein